MDRTKTIKVLRDIALKLKDEALFNSSDFEPLKTEGGLLVESRVNQYIAERLGL